MQRYKKSIRNGKGFLGAIAEIRALSFSYSVVTLKTIRKDWSL